MPEQFGFKEKIIHKASELSPWDKDSQKRAEWFINETGIEDYLKKDGQYLDVGTGKGHITQRILEDMEKRDTTLKGYYGIDIASKPLKKVQKREQTRTGIDNKNPMNFSWATAEALPFKDQSLDGVSYNFAIHHMNKEDIDNAFKEAKRVIKQEGRIFIAEDLVETEEQKRTTEEIDRKLNVESKKIEHNYKSDEEWKEYFADNGLELINEKFFHSDYKKGSVQHGFYVLKLKEE